MTFYSIHLNLSSVFALGVSLFLGAACGGPNIAASVKDTLHLNAHSYVLPMTIVDSVSYEDGGTSCFELADARNERLYFCEDRRAFSKTARRLYLYAHPDAPNSELVDTAEKEAVIYRAMLSVVKNALGRTGCEDSMTVMLEDLSRRPPVTQNESAVESAYMFLNAHGVKNRCPEDALPP